MSEDNTEDITADNLGNGGQELPKADWENHHIEGYARAAMEQGKDGYFDAPLISHIIDNLWTGGCIQGVKLPDDFVQVVSLYPWEQYALGKNTERLEVKMYDSSEGASFTDLVEASNAVLDGLKRGKTLVHCQAGLNRSSLVAAFTLMRLGYSAERAIALLREKRDELVLCNATFEKQLYSIEAVRSQWYKPFDTNVSPVVD